jgi:hypothetical protein
LIDFEIVFGKGIHFIFSPRVADAERLQKGSAVYPRGLDLSLILDDARTEFSNEVRECP